MNIIETHHLAHCYWQSGTLGDLMSPGNRWRNEAVRDLTFAVPEGSVFALLGPNGSGKTTTIKVLMNLLTPTRGDAKVLGVDSRQLAEREFAQIGYVSENQKLPDWMTVRQYLDYCRPFYPRWDQALEKTLLEQFDLPGDRKLRNLSRGMAMKTALLSALAYRPRLLVLDEPFSGLDPLVRDEVVRGLLEVAEHGDWSVLISSHDIEEVERLCDWIGVLDAGRLQSAEATDALLGRFRRMEVVAPGGAAMFEAVPGDWWEFNREGELVRFVASRYEAGATERLCRERFPDAVVTATPMTLREIFILRSRARRGIKQGANA